MSYELYVKLLFENFSEQELKELMNVSTSRLFHSGDYLFKEGEESNTFYIIFTGRVEISSSTENKEKISFPALFNGTVIGEVAFFDGKPRTASARALEDIHAMEISKDDFSKLELENPRIAIKVLKEIGKITAERLRWADERVKELSNQLNKI